MKTIPPNEWLWLCMQKELYRPSIAALLKNFETPQNIFHAPEKEIMACSRLNDAQKQSILRSRNVFDPVKTYHELESAGIRFISVASEEYPDRLREIIDYPYGIFVKGKLLHQDAVSVGIIGSRRCSYYGRKMAEQLAEVLAGYGVWIISGMAGGIDGYAQMKALEAGGFSLGVLGSGVDICYPRQNRELYQKLPKQGGVISEYPPGREPLAYHFPIRNRIISALSDCLLVIEAREKSGSLITADLALEQGKDILALPGRVNDPLSAGCNRLISQGAGIILSAEELVKQLNLNKKSNNKKEKNKFVLETKEKLVYSCVDFIPKSVDEIVIQTKLPVQEVMAVLTLLEMKGYIEEPTKNYYAKLD